jgi:hypothetical protein
MLEAKKGKGFKSKHSNVPPEPKVEGGKKSNVHKQVETSKKKGMKALQLEENEVEASEMANTLAKGVKHLKEMKSLERRLRSQLRLVLEKKESIEQEIADLL